MKLVDVVMKKARQMTIFDYSVFKTMLLVLGMIIGAYCASFVKEYIVYFWITFAVLYILLIYKVYIRKRP
jgi:uncharacterized membrane protein YfcA